MNKKIRPIFKKQIKIEGPCLLLVGPIGTFSQGCQIILKEIILKIIRLFSSS